MTINKNENQARTKSMADHPELVTVTVAGQLLGLPIHQVHDVFVPSDMTPVPLAPPEVSGLLNLRGRVVTAVSLRRRMGINGTEPEGRAMAVGVESKGEAYGLLVDDVGEVLRLDPKAIQPNPVHLDRRWSRISKGVHQLDGSLLIVLDVDAVLAFAQDSEAA